VKTRNDTTRSVRSRNATCLAKKRAIARPAAQPDAGEAER
jgi:hypothetical protein